MVTRQGATTVLRLEKCIIKGKSYVDTRNCSRQSMIQVGSHIYVLLRYVVIKKLGWGHFSTVWMVKDRRASPTSKETFFALKVQKSAEHYTEAAMDEVELLDCISKERKTVQQLANKGEKDSDGVPQSDEIEFSKYTAILHDSFFHTGPNGRHMCMVFSMLGCNLLSVIKAYNYRGIPIEVVKNMIRGICKGLDFLHRKCQIIHTDLKPENVLLQFEFFDDDPLVDAMGAMAIENNDVVQSISDLEIQLEGETLTQVERKKLRRKLKKKRQKERKKAGADNGESSDEVVSDDDDNDNDSTDGLDSSFLSDSGMSNFLYNAGYPMGSEESGKIASNVKRRLSHSAFVTTNFGHRHETADAKLMEVMRDSVGLKQLSTAEIDADLKAAESNGGVAEVSFLLRAFTPEEELAEGISSAFDGIAWEFKDFTTTREW
jgi:serine/threonine protein kinase